MKIIPVIDIKSGIVVSAYQGKRESYHPVRSILANSCSIKTVINGFLSFYPFNTIYIADLNAITHTGNNAQLIQHIIKQYSDIEFWVDNGSCIHDFQTPLPNNYRPILGSENQKSYYLNKTTLVNRYILSLDFFPKTGYAGPRELLINSQLWPLDVIIMSLDFIGSKSGPDMERLEGFRRKHPEKNFIAAGGIRNIADLLKLEKIGINHALMATALHSGEIDSENIKKLAPKSNTSFNKKS